MATHSSILAWRIPMDRGPWRATVLRVSKSWTCLKRHTHRHTHTRTHRHTHRHTDTDTQTQTHTHRYTQTQTHTQTQTDRYTDIHTQTHTDRHTDTHRHTQTHTRFQGQSRKPASYLSACTKTQAGRCRRGPSDPHQQASKRRV